MPNPDYTYIKSIHEFKTHFTDIHSQTCLRSFKYRYISKLLAPVVEDDPEAPFSIATKPKCRGGRYSFPRIAPL